MNWSGKKVLVTGAGGFIGSHLAERLVDLGADVRALVRYSSTGSWGWLERSPVKDHIEVILGDIRDNDSVTRVVNGVDTVFHLDQRRRNRKRFAVSDAQRCSQSYPNFY
jgi:nucleoside-diphosphate-sugar epimerase